MKRTFVALLPAALLALAFTPYHGNLPGKTELALEEGKITIEYVAPAYRGRDIDEAIQQPGANPWRLGADRPTVMTTPVALEFGDQTLTAGRYVLRAYLDDGGKWWLQAYDSNREVAGQMPLERSESDESEQHLVISLEGSADQAHLRIQWGTHVLSGSFSAE